MNNFSGIETFPHPLTLNCSLATPVVAVTGQPRLVYVLIEIMVRQADTGTFKAGQGLPLNLGLIIDCSDSMRIRMVTEEQFSQLAKGGHAQEILTDGVPAYQITSLPSDIMNKFPRRIDYVAEALIIASEYLRPVDHFSLVAFASQARKLIEATSGSDRARLRQAARELEYLSLGDSTDMAEGLSTAFSETNKTANSGKYASRMILLTDGHTKKVNECYSWARRAREVGITLTTMGIGSEFNEELLIPLADLTGGNAYYIESADQLPTAFRQELGIAQRIRYSNLHLDLQTPGSVTLRRAHRVTPELGAFEIERSANGAYHLRLGNFDPASPPALLLELVIPAWKAGDYQLARAILKWDDPEAGQMDQHLDQDIQIRLASMLGQYPPNEHVMNIVELVGAYQQGTRALEQASQTQDKGSATIRLRQAATRLLEIGEPVLAEGLLRQAQSLETIGNLDPSETKKLRYETRRIVHHPDELGR